MRHLYLYYDTCSGKTDGYATLARSSSSSLSLSPPQAKRRTSGLAESASFDSAPLYYQPIAAATPATLRLPPNREHTPESP